MKPLRYGPPGASANSISASSNSGRVRTPSANVQSRTVVVFRLIALALVVAFISIPVAQERPLPEFATFAEQAKKKLATDEERQSGYMFVERRTEQKLDGSDRPTSESVKVFEVYPGLPGQDRYRRLIEQDGKPIAARKLAQQDRERRNDVESYVKKMASASDRRK